MQETCESSLDITFPKKYLQRLEEYKKQQLEGIWKPRRTRKPPKSPTVFSNNCKQAIPFAKKTYCCALKELIDRALCKACPCFEREPLEYTLFRRV